MTQLDTILGCDWKWASYPLICGNFKQKHGDKPVALGLAYFQTNHVAAGCRNHIMSNL